MSVHTQSRAKLRRRMQRQRQSVTANRRTQDSAALAKRLFELPQVKAARFVAVYTAGFNEVDPLGGLLQGVLAKPNRALASVSRQRSKLLVPKTYSRGRMEFYTLQAYGRPLRTHKLGMPLGLMGRRVPARLIDVVVLPLTACDLAGARLGMGGGFYDRFLLKAPAALKIGAAYNFQLVEHIDTMSWDQRLDGLVTPTQVVWF